MTNFLNILAIQVGSIEIFETIYTAFQSRPNEYNYNYGYYMPPISINSINTNGDTFLILGISLNKFWIKIKSIVLISK